MDLERVASAYPVIAATGPVLVFGGPYGNLEATTSVLGEAERLGIPADHTICTGDLVAYCGSPAETIGLVRDAGIHVVMGNCDEQLANGAEDCACGYPEGSSCERLSSAWFAYADRETGPDARRWLANLPRRIDLQIGGLTLAVIHGSPTSINAFVFATSAAMSQDLAGVARDGVTCDGVIGGHCGLPFTAEIGGRLWHNPGVVGMPGNDGTPRVWYSVITSVPGGIDISHRALSYDHATAARKMAKAGLPRAYMDALSTGRWPSLEVLPERERAISGLPLESGVVAWRAKQVSTISAIESSAAGPASKVLWPAELVVEPSAAPARDAA